MTFATVPNLGLGIKPFGPKTLPNLPTLDIMSGVQTKISKSTLPLLISSTRSSDPNFSAFDNFASSIFSFEQITATLIFLPFPWGKSTVVLNV